MCAIRYNVVISICEKANRPDDINRLLDHRIAAGIFRPTLGFSAGKNMLDLHENAIIKRAIDSARPGGGAPGNSPCGF